MSKKKNMKELLESIEEFFNGLSPMVKDTTSHIKENLLTRVSNLENLPKPEKFNELNKITQELNKISELNSNLGKIFRNK